MQARFFWPLATLAVFGAILILPARVGPVGIWVYGSGYFLLGIGLLGTVARSSLRSSPALWRPSMLSIGSLIAVLEVWFHAGRIDTPPIDRWMLALVGLLVAAILVRLVPERLGHVWLGIDRRVHDQGA